MCLPRPEEPLNANDPNLVLPNLDDINEVLDIPQIVVTPPTPPDVRAAPRNVNEVSMLMEEVPQCTANSDRG